MVWIISWADHWVSGLMLCQHGEKMCDENTWMWRSFMQASGIPERPMSPPSPSPCCVEYNYTEADICMHHSSSVSLYSPRPGNSPNYTNLAPFWRGQYYYRLLLVAVAVLSDTEGLVAEISVKRECRLLSQLLLLNLLNCCFSIFWTVASQSRIENSQSGWFNKIRQSGMDLLKRGDNINLISDKQPLNMFSILGKFQLCIILKQRMLLEQRESVWTRKICLSFFQHWPLLALDREYWGGFGGSCWYQISHFCNWRGECYLCPPDPSLSKY